MVKEKVVNTSKCTGLTLTFPVPCNPVSEIQVIPGHFYWPRRERILLSLGVGSASLAWNNFPLFGDLITSCYLWRGISIPVFYERGPRHASSFPPRRLLSVPAPWWSGPLLGGFPVLGEMNHGIAPHGLISFRSENTSLQTLSECLVAQHLARGATSVDVYSETIDS